MKKCISASVALLVAGVGGAIAQPMEPSNFDLSILGGWTSHPALAIAGTHDGMTDGYNVGARLADNLDGYVPWSGFSVAADYLHNQSDYAGTGGQLGSSSYMGDVIYRLPVSMPVGIYGGAGVGAVQDELDGTLRGSSTVLGWQALGGLDYSFSPDRALFVEYRYQNAHDANVGAASPVGNTSNNLSVGIKLTL